MEKTVKILATLAMLVSFNLAPAMAANETVTKHALGTKQRFVILAALLAKYKGQVTSSFIIHLRHEAIQALANLQEEYRNQYGDLSSVPKQEQTHLVRETKEVVKAISLAERFELLSSSMKKGHDKIRRELYYKLSTYIVYNKSVSMVLLERDHSIESELLDLDGLNPVDSFSAPKGHYLESTYSDLDLLRTFIREMPSYGDLNNPSVVDGFLSTLMDLPETKRLGKILKNVDPALVKILIQHLREDTGQYMKVSPYRDNSRGQLRELIEDKK